MGAGGGGGLRGRSCRGDSWSEDWGEDWGHPRRTEGQREAGREVGVGLGGRPRGVPAVSALAFSWMNRKMIVRFCSEVCGLPRGLRVEGSAWDARAKAGIWGDMGDGGPGQVGRTRKELGEGVRFWGDLESRGNEFSCGWEEGERQGGWSWHPESRACGRRGLPHVQGATSGKQPGAGAEWAMHPQVWGPGATSAPERRRG